MEERTNGFRPVRKKKGSFNMMDFLLILMVVCVLLFVVVVLDPFSLDLFDNDSERITLEYTVRIENVDGALLDAIQKSDEILDSAVRCSLGFVNEVSNVPYTEPYYNVSDEAGENVAIMQELPNRYNIEIVISAEAVFEEGVGYQINGRRIAVGTKIHLMLPNYLGDGYCIGLREVK